MLFSKVLPSHILNEKTSKDMECGHTSTEHEGLSVRCVIAFRRMYKIVLDELSIKVSISLTLLSIKTLHTYLVAHTFIMLTLTAYCIMDPNPYCWYITENSSF